MCYKHLQFSCGRLGTTTGIWSRVWTLVEILRRLLFVFAGTQFSPCSCILWPAAGLLSHMCGAGLQNEVWARMPLTMPVWLWLMEVKSNRMRAAKTMGPFSDSMLFIFLQIKSLWHPSDSVSCLLPCAPLSSSWPPRWTRWPFCASHTEPMN